MTNDTMHPLVLFYDCEKSLADTHPAAFVERIRHRYLSTLFRPTWGYLFTEESDHADHDRNDQADH